MAGGQVQVDTTQMVMTAQKSANIADNIIGHAQVLRSGIDFVLGSWQGQSGEAFRTSMQNQKTTLDQLIRKLQQVSDQVKQGGQGFDSQDAAGRSRTQAQGSGFLSSPLNG
jgi:WXG100 family type VII secretion target